MLIQHLNRAVVNVSFRSTHYIVMGILIGNIRVSINKKVNATITNKSQHLVTPELLAKKWGIDSEKGKDMLKTTTQDVIFSALLNLTGRYHAYLIL